ncbi:MAG: glycosyltransferase family 4 protein [Deferribacteres bacterium]|nr:glycosyltransferase family 4 protein [candidate division KSB1 bacterium]MCB9503353.1 glycosyltransferase family 4 protein [Deferribacteres bacterium]
MADPIRVLHVIDKFSMDGVNPSSCSRLFAQWIPLHNKEKFQVDVVGLRPKDASGAYLEQHGIKVYYIEEGKYSPKNINAIAEIARKGNYDILHLHGYSSANFGRLAGKKSGAKTIVHEHAVLKVLPHQYIIDWLLRNKGDVGLGVSKAVKEFMVKGRSVPSDAIDVIWNGIPIQEFTRIDAGKVAQFRESLDVPNDAFLIGTVTRLREEKGNKYLLDAFAEIAKSNSNVYLVLVGDGPLKAELQQQAHTLNVAARIRFTGFVADIPVALGALDLVVIPSLREGFGLALVEAMAAGKPIVASYVGGMRELAENERNALMTPPADVSALVQAINRLINDVPFRTKISAQARKDAEQYSIEKNVEKLEELYTRMTNGRKE